MRYQSYESPLTLFDVIGAGFRYKGRAILVTGLMLLLCAAAILLFPKKYESEAKLFVRLGRGSASIDPATVGQTISIQESRETEMNSMIDLLQSRSLAERIVDEIGHERILKKHAWIEVQADRLMELLQAKSNAVLSTQLNEVVAEGEAVIDEFVPSMNENAPTETTEEIATTTDSQDSDETDFSSSGLADIGAALAEHGDAIDDAEASPDVLRSITEGSLSSLAAKASNDVDSTPSKDLPSENGTEEANAISEPGEDLLIVDSQTLESQEDRSPEGNDLAEAGMPLQDVLSAEELEKRKRIELAIKEVQSNLKIDSPKRSTTIGVAFRARDPELAKDVVEAAISNYKDLHIAAYESQGALEFFDRQFDEQQRLVASSEESLKESKNKHHVVTMKGKQESLQSEITDVKKMQLQAKADLHAALAQVSELESDMTELEAEIVASTTSGIASNATDSMRDRLYELEIQEKELASKYVASDPRLIRVRTQLQDARQIVDEQPTEKPQSVVAVNPVRQHIENELLIAKASVASLQAKSTALEDLEDDLLIRLSEVNELEVMAEEMQRKIDIAKENHRNYARKLEESRINAALDAQLLSNVSVVGKPTTRYKHVSPKRSLLAVLAACFSMICGIMVALLSDYSRNAKEIALIRRAERAAYLKRLEQAQHAASAPLAIEELELANSASATAVAGSDSAAAANESEAAPSDMKGEPVEHTPKKAK